MHKSYPLAITSESEMDSFNHTLQSVLLPHDEEWSFVVPNLPKASVTNEKERIKSISVVSNSSEQRIALRFVPYSPNRAIKRTELDHYIAISFKDFRLYYPPTKDDEKPRGKSFNTASTKESAGYIIRLLCSGVSINGIRYHFYGHSNSRLKSRSCFLYAGTPKEISQKVERLGDFSMKSIAKKVKRIGLLFFSAQIALDLQPDRTRDIPDVVKGNYIFTDGCGFISKHLAKKLIQKLDIRFRDKRYTPTVFQIRYRGYKGVVTLEPKLQGQILIEFRESEEIYRRRRSLVRCD